MEVAQSSQSEVTTAVDILYVVRGIPSDMYAGDTHWKLVSLAGEATTLLNGIADSNLDFRHFLNVPVDLALGGFVYRAEAMTVGDALDHSFKILAGLLDAYALITDVPPRVATIALVRTDNGADAELYYYSRGGAATVLDRNSGAEHQWNARNQLLLQRMLHYMDIVAGDKTAPHSELRENLAYAMRLYRQGAESKYHGVELLSKFSALETLVCGDITHAKESTLVSRLTSLFDHEPIASEARIRSLWALRCGGSHQARINSDVGVVGPFPEAVAVLYVDEIFPGVAYFTLESAYQCETVDELWNTAPSYTLPELIVRHRPGGIARMAVSSTKVRPHIQVKGAGLRFDAVFNA